MGRTKTPVDGRELVGKHWPYDGPHSYDTVVEAARAMSELAQYLGNATGPGNGTKTLQYGPRVYRVLGAITDAIGSLDQVLEQLATAEERAGADPNAYDDRRDRPASQTTEQVIEHINAARYRLFRQWPDKSQTVHSHLQEAHSLSSHIGHD